MAQFALAAPRSLPARRRSRRARPAAASGLSTRAQRATSTAFCRCATIADTDVRGARRGTVGRTACPGVWWVAVQALFMTPELRGSLYAWQYEPGAHGEPARCLTLQLQKLFAVLQVWAVGFAAPLLAAAAAAAAAAAEASGVPCGF